MKKTLYLCLLFLLTGAFVPQRALAQSDVLAELEAIAVIDQKVMMPMRDGVRLATDIYRPKTDEPVPVVFSKTPYNFNAWGDGEMRTRTYDSALEWVNNPGATARSAPSAALPRPSGRWPWPPSITRPTPP